MKVICIGNYPPRQCGIATFTENLVQSIIKAADSRFELFEIEIIAMNDAGQNYSYPPMVTHAISDQILENYIKAASYVNRSKANVCLLQHEYGIFGGESGILLLALLRRIKIPVITTFHSVLEKPSFHQKEIMHKIAAHSARVVVMNELAIDILEEIYQVPRTKLLRIQHGVPDFASMKPQLKTKPPEWKERKVMLTFGLIGRSKGIETVLRALPEIVKNHPKVLYVVLGKTHPSILRFAGEEYREFLYKIIKDLNIENHVHFINQYVNELDLMSYLNAADIYVTPYLNKAQITSGTLSYAVASGCAVLSTPYWHAEEMLTSERGKLFDFHDSQQLSQMVNDLLQDPSELERLKKNAFDYGKQMTWSIIGNSYLSLFHETIAESKVTNKAYGKPFSMPDLDIKHLIRLTDNIGILQHARTCIPYYKTGYCLDDNSRALNLCLLGWKKTKKEKLLKLMEVYLSYILYMQKRDGSFNNLLSFDRMIITEDPSDDTFGRAFWALGLLINESPNDAMAQLGIDMIRRSESQLLKLRYARGYANSIMGLAQYIQRFPDQERYCCLMKDLADRLCDQYDKCRHQDWHWFEDTLTYDNGLLPASLYKAYRINADDRYLKIAEESRLFLESHCFQSKWLSLIGNKIWLNEEEEFDHVGQQPIDAMAMIIMYDSAYQALKNKKFIEKIKICFQWFVGYNDLNVTLIDSETKGCSDGIEAFNINRNQGAESTISYLISLLIAEPYFELDT